MFMDDFMNMPLLGILRGIKAGDVDPLAGSIASSGLKAVEIAMNTEIAPSLIRSMIKSSKKRFYVGAGTVLDMDSLRSALDAGAGFIVMPALVSDVAAYCVKNRIPVFPGAFTPGEIYEAWKAGAAMVKVFPARFFGPAYFREIRGPFRDIKLLACGGVSAENIGEFFKAGADAAAFGESVFRKEWIQSKMFSKISEAISGLIKSADIQAIQSRPLWTPRA